MYRRFIRESFSNQNKFDVHDLNLVLLHSLVEDARLPRHDGISAPSRCPSQQEHSTKWICCKQHTVAYPSENKSSIAILGIEKCGGEKRKGGSLDFSTTYVTAMMRGLDYHQRFRMPTGVHRGGNRAINF
eukprot:2675192-Rhodomonas_salina.2